ncbi:prephenate dehydrogenase [Bifidobacterium aemilianum]|uniref:Prephenate dehydrogenase n=1 Tax=Bifidobacterium aemilianum TaxID=2493120 RepID=A0A366KAS9_9BIFI|nr:prephenate dehydrogenase/arogenate dehydrogenase family protein [Bifidobacterium aemilianum]RBP98223.1 prephenate dehydrogenase [Bifidobacterium aemilianum]
MVRTVGIVGLGLIGGSLARRMVDAGCQVLAWNHTPRPYAAAQADGIECLPSLQALAEAKPELLVLCNPLRAMPDMLAALAPVMDPASTLTDVGSVKGLVREQVRQAGLESVYVGAHPMTGNERSGFAASDPELFDDALWAVTVDQNTDFQRFLQVSQTITETLHNRLIVLDDHTHDRAAALISHMPHAVATALINQLCASPERNVALALSAGSWRDMTRVALTDPQRTRAMIDENPINVEALLRRMADRLVSYADAIREGREEAMQDFFTQGQPFRQVKAQAGRPPVPAPAHARTPEEPAQQEPAEADSSQQAKATMPLSLSPSTWQETLINSAKQGQRIVSMPSADQAIVLQGPTL